ncbi:hypothetical protein CVT24_000083 [Panaeolus cyanescens]|uniref:Uncharacterized protein n=1 Tax=Panaeolus cyanescens TaxID=181874 RepID=A0A409X7Z0_9AGAR|nr:hypothetical protein CVT24_000083 [Panaeolus cyanescens]
MSDTSPPPLPPLPTPVVILTSDEFEVFLNLFATKAASCSSKKKSSPSKGKSRIDAADNADNSDDNEGIPAFVNSAGVNSTSLSESFTLMFPHILREVLVKVLYHNLDINNLYKLDPTFSDCEMDKVKVFSFEDDDEGNVTIQRKAVTGAKAYPNLSSVLAPLLVLFEIIHTHTMVSDDHGTASEIARASSHYCSAFLLIWA